MSTKAKKSEETPDEFGGIFSLTAADVTAEAHQESTSSDPDFYTPGLSNKNVKEGFYKSLIRFVPNVNNRAMQNVVKPIYFLADLKNPERKVQIDCPHDKNNIVTQAYFMLKDHESLALRKVAKDNFIRKWYVWSLVQVIRDGFNAELNGKIKIFRYAGGNPDSKYKGQIEEKMDVQLKEDKATGKKVCIVQDPFEGKDFNLYIDEKKTDDRGKMTSYEKSYFLDERSSITLDFQNLTRLPKNEANMKQIFEYLKKESPDLAKVAHKAWSPQDEEFAIESVKKLIEDDELFAKVYRKAYNKPYFNAAPAAEKKAEAPAASTEAKPEAAKPASKAKVEALKETVVSKEKPAAAATKTDEAYDVTKVEIKFDEIE